MRDSITPGRHPPAGPLSAVLDDDARTSTAAPTLRESAGTSSVAAAFVSTPFAAGSDGRGTVVPPGPVPLDAAVAGGSEAGASLARMSCVSSDTSDFGASETSFDSFDSNLTRRSSSSPPPPSSHP